MHRLLLALLLLFSVPIAFPQNKSTAEATEDAAVIQKLETHVHFENDGTGYHESTAVVKVTSEAGVEAYGQLAFGYSSETEKLEIAYVRVRKPSGEIVETPASATNDFAPLAMQSAPMYDDYRERHVSVVSLRPGDVLEYRVTTRIVSALSPGQFWYEYSFPDSARVEQATLTIDVPRQREVKLKSPARQFTTTESGESRTYTWTVANLAPLERKPNDDSSSEDDFPDIQLSSFTDWKQVARWYADLQGKQVVVDDAVRKKAAELTSGVNAPEEKARRLYDFVAREFRYVSLSFGVGRYLPHASTEVLRTSYGDCKDKHTLFSALLQAAGISSYPVLIGAGRRLDPDVPSPSQFNHVFTMIQLPGKTVWADTTAEVAPFGLISYVLRDQQAVIASKDASGGLTRTPALAPVRNSLLYSMTGKVTESGALDATVELTTDGDSALLLRSAFRSTSQNDWKKLLQFLQFLMMRIDDNASITNIAVDALETPSQPLKIKYHVQRDAYFTVPNAQANFFPFLPIAYGALPKKTHGDEPLRVGPAGEVVHRVHLELPKNFAAELPSDITVSREYGTYEAHFKVTNNILEAERKLVITVDSVPLLRRADIETLRTVASSPAEQTITFNISPAAEAVRTVSLASTANMSPEELQRGATQALEQQEFRTASSLLQQLVVQQPSSDQAWEELGRAYRGLGDQTQAVTAFRKQVEVAPKHKLAYADLGATLRDLGKDDEAVTVYRKHLEIVPLDTTVRKQLGLALFRLKRDPEAITELENASTPPSVDPQVQLALAELYARNNQGEHAKSIFTHVLGISAPNAETTLFAEALAANSGGAQLANEARGALSDLGDQFDSGGYADPAAALDVMPLVALEWARVGWGEGLNGNSLEALRFLNSAWTLDPSPTLGLRLAGVHIKAGHLAEARHMLALAAAGDGADAEEARTQLAAMDPAGAESAISKAKGELSNMQGFPCENKTRVEGHAKVILVFDGSSQPQRIVYVAGDIPRKAFESTLAGRQYQFTFPDNSSIKIMREAQITCSGTLCKLAFERLGNVLP